MPEVVNIKEDAAERGVHPLHAIRLLEKQRKQRTAVVGARQCVELGVLGYGRAQKLYLMGPPVSAKDEFNPEPPPLHAGTAGDKVVDHAFAEPQKGLLAR